MATSGTGPGGGPERAFCHPLPEGGRVRLDAEESAHLVRVRRVALGNPVVLFDGRGGSRLATLVAAEGRCAEAEVLGPYPDREPAGRLVLAASPPEGSRSDALVAALAELGATAWIPLRSARTPPGRVEATLRRADRFARLIREAAKVNGRSRFLEVERPSDLADVVRRASSGTGGILLDPDPGAPTLAHLLAARPDPSPDLPLLLIGPEGGFTAEERAHCRAAGLPSAQLLATALRTETAALAAAAVALAVAGT